MREALACGLPMPATIHASRAERAARRASSRASPIQRPAVATEPVTEEMQCARRAASIAEENADLSRIEAEQWHDHAKSLIREKRAILRAQQAKERIILELQLSVQASQEQNRAMQQQLEAQADKIEALTAARRRFQDHLKSNRVLIPGTDGRIMQDDWWQVREHGPACHICQLHGHWRDRCPHGFC